MTLKKKMDETLNANIFYIYMNGCFQINENDNLFIALWPCTLAMHSLVISVMGESCNNRHQIYIYLSN